MRSRIVHPELLANEVLGKADPYCTILFVGLWMLADREGRFLWRPDWLRAQVFPYRTMDILPILEFLRQKNFIAQYEVDGDQFGIVRKFKEYQKIHPHEARSRIPAPVTVIKCNDIVTPCIDIGNHTPHVNIGTGTSTEVVNKKDLSTELIPKKPPKVTVERSTYGENKFVELSDEEFEKLSEKYGHALDDGIQTLDTWISKKRGQLTWFKKEYSSAFNYLNPKNCWIWIEHEKKHPRNGNPLQPVFTTAAERRHETNMKALTESMELGKRHDANGDKPTALPFFGILADVSDKTPER